MICDILRLLSDFMSGGDPTYDARYPQLLSLVRVLSWLRDVFLELQ